MVYKDIPSASPMNFSELQIHGPYLSAYIRICFLARSPVMHIHKEVWETLVWKIPLVREKSGSCSKIFHISSRSFHTISRSLWVRHLSHPISESQNTKDGLYYKDESIQALHLIDQKNWHSKVKSWGRGQCRTFTSLIITAHVLGNS